MSHVWTCHSWTTHQSGTCGLFPSFGYTNEAAINIPIQLCKHEVPFLWVKYPGARLPGWTVVRCLVFWETARNSFPWRLHRWAFARQSGSDPVSPGLLCLVIVTVSCQPLWWAVLTSYCAPNVHLPRGSGGPFAVRMPLPGLPLPVLPSLRMGCCSFFF